MKPARPDLRLIRGGLSQESAAKLVLYPERRRSVKAEPQPARHPKPVPPTFKPAA